MTTDERIVFLGQYGEYARRFFKDEKLDTQVVGDDEVADFLKNLKPQKESHGHLRHRIPVGSVQKPALAVAVLLRTHISQFKNTRLL